MLTYWISRYCWRYSYFHSMDTKLMTDLTHLINLSTIVSIDPTEEHLEAFLQAYNATQQPTNQAEFVLFEVLGDMTVNEYMAEECVCDHEHDNNQL